MLELISFIAFLSPVPVVQIATPVPLVALGSCGGPSIPNSAQVNYAHSETIIPRLDIASAIHSPTIWLEPPQAPAPNLMMTGSATDLATQHQLWRANDGLFYTTLMVNGQPVRFLVDTGASLIVLTAADAQRVGAAPSTGKSDLDADTAAGKSKMAPIMITAMSDGMTAASDVRAAVAREGLQVSLLGQNWLSHLSSVTIEGDRMTMR